MHLFILKLTGVVPGDIYHTRDLTRRRPAQMVIKAADLEKFDRGELEPCDSTAEPSTGNEIGECLEELTTKAAALLVSLAGFLDRVGDL